MEDKDKKALLKLARESIASYFSDTEPDTAKVAHLSEKQGVFVTLHKHGDLRGCIGFPYPLYPLYKAVLLAAREAAFGDPRFSPLTQQELDEITLEISVLSVPEELKVKTAREYLGKVRIGSDGLIIKGMFGSGLLLPQVATEYKFTPEAFLECVCQKAGMEKSAWQNLSNRIFTFHAEVFNDGKRSRKRVGKSVKKRGK
jgi:AmmeMemoRadiSam system protein A